MNKKTKTRKHLNRKTNTRTKSKSNKKRLPKFLDKHKYANIEYTVNKIKPKLYVTQFIVKN